MGIRQRYWDSLPGWYEVRSDSPFAPLMRWHLAWRVMPGELPSPRKLRRLRVASAVGVPATVAMLLFAWFVSGFKDERFVLWPWTVFVVGGAAREIWVAWFRTYPYGVLRRSNEN